MLCDILFVLFFFFTHKIVYSASHFTGASQAVKTIIGIDSIFCLIFEIGYLISFAIRVSVLHAIILFAVSLVVTVILNRVFSKITLNNLIKNGWNIKDELFIYTYNHKCDVMSTGLSLIGIPVNIIIIILLFLF